MNHPTKEDLISLLYDELNAQEGRQVKAHLQQCRECEARLAEWTQVKAELQIGPEPCIRKSPLHFTQVARWAAAALFVLGIGFGFGWLAAPQPDFEPTRAALELQLRQTLAQELQAARAADHQEMTTLLEVIEKQRLADYAQLRNDLENVLAFAEEKLNEVQQRWINEAFLLSQTEMNSSEVK